MRLCGIIIAHLYIYCSRRLLYFVFSNMASSDSTHGVIPVFIVQTDALKDINGLAICQAVAQVLGDASQVEGAQLRRYPRGSGLWRIYTTSQQARATLLSEGLSIRDVAVELNSQNPFATGASNPDVRSLKITVKDIPLSFANDCVKNMFSSLGIKITS